MCTSNRKDPFKTNTSHQTKQTNKQKIDKHTNPIYLWYIACLVQFCHGWADRSFCRSFVRSYRSTPVAIFCQSVDR